MGVRGVGERQVAGHGLDDPSSAPLIDDSGGFYKPLQNGTRGEREAEFYVRVLEHAAADTPTPSTSLSPLQHFVPRTCACTLP
jgi:1D-myo-inositol-tetrakisphosphate 5-kinase/inositol-polyphosphate multikinase